MAACVCWGETAAYCVPPCAGHNCHAPQEVPQAVLDKFSYIDSVPRGIYAAKVCGSCVFRVAASPHRIRYAAPPCALVQANFMDTVTGEIVAALKAAGMWENTLLVATSDNVCGGMAL